MTRHRLLTLALLGSLGTTAALPPDVAFAAPAAAKATPARTTTYLPVLKRGLLGTKDPAQRYADIIVDAVNKDPTGKAPLEGSIGGYNPRQVYETLRRYHPDKGFTNPNPGEADFLAMAEYISTLKVRKLGKARKMSNSRIKQSGGVYTLDLDWSRVLPADTLVLVDVNDGTVMFKVDCGNGTDEDAPPPPAPENPCDYILVPAETKDAILSVAAAGDYRPDPRCPLRIQGPGTGPNGQFFASSGYKKLRPCAKNPCDWTRAENYYGGKVKESGDEAVGKGWWSVQIDRASSSNAKVLVYLCLRDKNRKVTRVLAVRSHHYGSLDGMRVATVWYDQERIPVEYRGKTDLVWLWAPGRVRVAGVAPPP